MHANFKIKEQLQLGIAICYSYCKHVAMHESTDKENSYTAIAIKLLSYTLELSLISRLAIQSPSKTAVFLVGNCNCKCKCKDKGLCL